MYFKEFPVLPYPYYIGDKKAYAIARNVLRRVAFSDRMNNTSAFIQYDIKDGERPEQIANRVYGNPHYHWVILIANNIIDPYHGWYKSQTAMEQYIQKKYSGVVLYFSDRDNGFTYSSDFFAGCTLSQNNKEESITDYRDTFCELKVETPKFSEGDAVIEVPNGATIGIHVHKILPAYLSVNRFAIERPSGTVDGSNGAQELPTVDPLSYQSADYEEYETVLGTRIQPSGINGATGATVEFWQTYIGCYMGISGDEINTYAISNYTHEQTENEKKRTINILAPAFLQQAIKELKAALGV